MCTFRAQELPDLKIQFGRVRLNGGNEYEYYQPICGGYDYADRQILDVSERSGRTGSMVFVITELTFKNQHGDGRQGRNTGIMRE